MLNRFRYRRLKSHQPKPANLQTYYAVGNPIKLTEWVFYPAFSAYSYSAGSADTFAAYSIGFHGASSSSYSDHREPEQYRQNVTPSYSMVRHSFTGNSWTVFATLQEAKSYCLSRATNSHNRNMDIFEAEVIPAVLAVQLNPDNLGRKELSVNEHIPDCPAPPKAFVNTFNAYTAPLASIQSTSYGFFAGKVVAKYKKDEFSKSFNRGLHLDMYKSDSKAQIFNAMTKLFGSYNGRFWHRYTRHHHDKIKVIMNMLADRKQSVGELSEFIRGRLEEANLDLKITHTGHYKRMLNFAFIKT